MRSREDHMTHDVVELQLAARHATTATALRLERASRYCLDVLSLGHHDDEFLVVGEIFDRHLADVVGQLTLAVGRELVADCRDLLFDDCVEAIRIIEDVLQVNDLETQLVEFGLEVNPGEPGQLTELHVQDVVGLNFGEFKRSGHEAVTGNSDIIACSDEFDNLVDDIEGLNAPLEDVLAMTGLLQPVLGPARDDFDLVVDVGNEGVAEGDLLGHALHERDHVDRERGLQLGELEQVVHHHVGIAIALKADDQLGLTAAGGVVHISNAIEIAVVDELLNTCSDRGAGGLVRQLGNDDLVATVSGFFD